MNNFRYLEEILEKLNSYEEIISYNEENIIEGVNWLNNNPFYSLIVTPNDNKCKKYLNRIGVCSRYITDLNQDVARKSNDKLNHVLSKMLGKRMINYIPYLQPSAPRVNQEVISKRTDSPTRENSTWYYAVRIGKNPGIYQDWASCSEQVLGYSNARFKKFSTFDQAEQFINQ